jgi:hypothetical protein
MLIIPVEVANDLLSHSRDMHGHQDIPQVFVLHGPDEPLDNGDAPMPANGAKARPDVRLFAPLLEAWMGGRGRRRLFGVIPQCVASVLPVCLECAASMFPVFGLKKRP